VGAWEGRAYYSTPTHGASNSFVKTLPAPSDFDAWNELEWDMAALTAGGTDYLDNEIRNIRIDLVSDATSVWEFDWVAIGSATTTPLSAALQVESTTRAAADQANATQVTTLEALVNGSTGLNSKASNSRVDQVVIDANGALALSVTTLQAAAANKVGGNMLLNPDFDSGGQLEILDNLDWSVNYANNTDSGVPPAAPVSRLIYLHAKRVTTGFGGFELLMRSGGVSEPTTGGDVIEISCWVYCENGAGNNGRFAITPGTSTESTLPGVGNFRIMPYDHATGGWQRKSVAYTMPAAATRFRFLVVPEPAVGTFKMWIGDIVVSRRSAGAALLEIKSTASSADIGQLYTQFTVKTDVAGLVSGYGLASSANNAAPTSAFGIQAGQFFVAPPAIVQATAPTVNRYKGMVWLDTSVNPAVRRFWSETAWSTTPQALPFVVQVVPETINGVTVDPGIYAENAFFARLVATRGQIGLLAVDDARIASLSAAKLTAGSIAVGQHIQSTSYIAGQQGWRISGSGSLEANTGTFRGQLAAAGGTFAGTVSAGGVELGADVGPGGGHFGLSLALDNFDDIFLRRSDGVRFFRVNAGGANRIAFDSGSGNLDIVTPQFSVVGGNANFAGSLNVKSAASGARMEITQNAIKVFDASGVKRVQIGDLTI
jgi:hypothetical protein